MTCRVATASRDIGSHGVVIQVQPQQGQAALPAGISSLQERQRIASWFVSRDCVAAGISSPVGKKKWANPHLAQT